jgi:hypothetical protein
MNMLHLLNSVVTVKVAIHGPGARPGPAPGAQLAESLSDKFRVRFKLVPANRDSESRLWRLDRGRHSPAVTVTWCQWPGHRDGHQGGQACLT